MRCKNCDGLAKDDKGYICIVAKAQHYINNAQPKVGIKKLPSGEYGCSRHNDFIHEAVTVWNIVTPPEEKAKYKFRSKHTQDRGK